MNILWGGENGKVVDLRGKDSVTVAYIKSLFNIKMPNRRLALIKHYYSGARKVVNAANPVKIKGIYAIQVVCRYGIKQ